MTTCLVASPRQFRAQTRQDQRARVEQLLARAEYLPELDRVLFEQSVENQMSDERLALLHQVSVHRLRRKLRRIRQTLEDPCFLLAAQWAGRLPAAMRPVARGYFVEGLTLRQCAARHQVSLHAVRQAVTLVRSVCVLTQAPAARAEGELQ